MPAKSEPDFVVMPPDVVAPVTSITATSVMGWGGFLISVTTLAMVAWDRVTRRGRSLADLDNKIDGLCNQIEELEGRLTVVDGLAKSVGELVFEWRGVEGNNGYKSIIRENQRRIAAIERRNDRLDAVRDADERRGGGQHRRLMDRELNNLLPEEREDK